MQLAGGVGGEAVEVEVGEVGVVGDRHQRRAALAGLDRGEHVRMLGEEVVEAGALTQGQGADQREAHGGALLVRPRAEPGVEGVEVGVGVEVGLVAHEAPAADVLRADPRRAGLEVDDEHVSRVGLVVVGHLGGARVADPVVVGVDPRGVAVAEGDVVRATVGQRRPQTGQPDHGGLPGVGAQDVELAVARDDAQRARRRRPERGELLAHEVGSGDASSATVRRRPRHRARSGAPRGYRGR